MARAHWLAAFVLFGVSIPLYSQVADTVLHNLDQGPNVAVTVMQRSKAVTAAFDVRLLVTNLTEVDLFVKKIHLIMPADFVTSRRGQRSVMDYRLLGEVQLKPGTQRAFAFQIPEFPPPLWPGNFGLLAFTPGDYQLQAVVTYRVPSQVDTDSMQLVPISLEPPLSSLLWGGAFGAVVLAAFVATYRWKRREEPARAILTEAVATALAGAVCAVVALLLLYRFEGLELPITISVRDFFGGVVVGLFSYKIGEVLYKQLWGGSDKAALAASALPKDAE